jgi:hypothetical protein
MNCRQAEQLIVRHLYGALYGRPARTLGDHLAACATCRRRLESYRANQECVLGLRRERPSSSPAIAAVHRWRQEREQAASARLFWGPRHAWSATAVACAAIITVALLALRHSPEANVAGGHEAGTPQAALGSHGLQTGSGEPIDLDREGSASGGAPRLQHHVPAPVPSHEDRSSGERVPQRTVRHEGQRIRPSRPGERTPRPVPAPATLPAEDLDYINADLKLVLHTWVPSAAAAAAARVAGAPVGKTGDFIYVRPPYIAGVDPGAARLAVRQHEREKATVDARLARKIDLAVKGISFSELCNRLADETGIHLRAARTVADEKVTIFCERQPLRDLMRQISRVFGYYWSRSGEEGAYRYELFQDLRSQLAEEELRNRDFNAALIALDEAMGAYRPFMELSRAEILSRLKGLPDGDRNRDLVKNAAGGGFAAIQAYMRLTPAEVHALRSGNEVRFNTEGGLPSGFPPDWASRLLESFQGIRTPDGELRVTSSTVTLSLDHTELGNVALNSFVSGAGIGFLNNLAVGRSPSASNPDNRAANKSLQNDPLFRSLVSLDPKCCLRADLKTAFGIDFNNGRQIDDDLAVGVAPPQPHLTSADVWQEVHARTGLPIVADYYTHLFPARSFTMRKGPLFEALCRSADAMGVRWRKDGSFLQCRSTAFFWDKLKEVPNRLLDRWEKDREAQGALPLDDLLEMAMLSDRQLDSTLVGQGVRHCRNLMEWGILADPQYAGSRRKLDQIRPFARFLAGLPSGLRLRALSPDGTPLTAFSPPQMEALTRIFHLGDLLPQIGGAPQSTRLRVSYVPSGAYMWRVTYDSLEEAEAAKWRIPLCVGKTRESALAAARGVYPKARPEDISRSHGTLAATFIGPAGLELTLGQRPAAVRFQP